jgi:DNA-binding NtrC family response regulator
MPRILIVVDEMVLRDLLKKILEGQGYDTTQAASGEAALRILQTEPFDLMITDIKMLPIDGMELFHKVREAHADMGVIFLTAHGSVSTAIEASKGGVFDYITKPFKLDKLLVTVKHALEYKKADVGSNPSEAEAGSLEKLEGIIAKSVSMSRVCDMIERIAPTSAPVLVFGEDGTGKELIGRSIHRHSPRNNNLFTTITCPAAPNAQLESELFGHVKGAFPGAETDKAGLFEAASGGTLFLHAINNLPLNIQTKVLGVLQEKQLCRVGGSDLIKVDVRIIAAANLPLEPLVERGDFLPGLCARLSALRIDVPPLRCRSDDILPLINYFLRKELGPEADLPVPDPMALEILDHYTWPGNVSELINVIQHALSLVQNGTFTREILPRNIIDEVEAGLSSGAIVRRREQFKGRALKEFLHEKSLECIERTFNRATGDETPAAG